MAVVSTKRLMRAGTGGGVDHQLNRSYELIYQVITDNMADGTAIVLLAPGLPALYSIYNADHEYDTGSVLTEYSPKRTDDPCIWEVTCKYQSWATILSGVKGFNPELQKALSDITSGTSSQMQPGGFDSQSPLSRPPRVAIGSRGFQRPLEFDLNGRACVNGSKERFDPPVDYDDRRLIVTITKNQACPLNLTTLKLYQNSVNSDVFLGQDIKSGKVLISANLQFENKILFWEVSYEIEFRDDLWDPYKVFNSGYHTLRITQALPGDPILNPDGSRCGTPTPLYVSTGAELPALQNVDGTTCIAGDCIVYPQNHPQITTPDYKGFKVFKTLPFANLNLGISASVLTS